MNYIFLDLAQSITYFNKQSPVGLVNVEYNLNASKEYFYFQEHLKRVFVFKFRFIRTIRLLLRTALSLSTLK